MHGRRLAPALPGVHVIADMHPCRDDAFEHTQGLFQTLLQRRIESGLFRARGGDQGVGGKQLGHFHTRFRRQRIEIQQVHRRREIHLGHLDAVADLAVILLCRADIVALQHRHHLVGLLLIKPVEQRRLPTPRQRQTQEDKPHAGFHDERSRVSAAPTALRTRVLSRLMSTLYWPICSCNTASFSG